MVTRGQVIKKVMELNPHIDQDDLLWRADGRIEWSCGRCGHTVFSPDGYFVHGCVMNDEGKFTCHHLKMCTIFDHEVVECDGDGNRK